MIKVIRLKTIKKILILMAVILIITALIKMVYASSSIKYKILVDVEESKLYLFENDELKKEYKCSGGKWSTPSPIGTWEITFKAKWGEGFRPEALWGLMYHGENLEYMELKIHIL